MKKLITLLLMISMTFTMAFTAYGATIPEIKTRIAAIDKELNEINAREATYNSQIAKYENKIVVVTMSSVLTTSPKVIVKGNLIGVGPVATGIQYAVIENPYSKGFVYGTYTGEHYIKGTKTMYVDGYSRNVYILGDYPKDVKQIINQHSGYADKREKLKNEKMNLQRQLIAQSEYPSKWAEEDINAAISNGIVPATLQSRYMFNITRSEMCDLLVGAFECLLGHPIEDIPAQSPYWDTYNPNVVLMSELGIVSGYGNGKFGPHDDITREQAAIILKNFIEFVLEENDPVNGVSTNFSDMNTVANWAKDSVNYVTSRKGFGYNIMGSSGNNRFAPKDGYTREQAIITVFRACGYISEMHP